MGDITFHGDQEPGSLHADNIALAQHPSAQAKIRRVLAKAPIVIHLLFVNHQQPYVNKIVGRYFAKGDDLIPAIGLLTAQQASAAFGFDIPARTDALTLVFGHDAGDDRLPFTPWIIAHRMLHAIYETHDATAYPLLHAQFLGISRMLDYMPAGVADPKLTIDSLLHAVGTFNSARQDRIGNAGEFVAEVFAQFLVTGRITLAPVGTSVRPVVGTREQAEQSDTPVRTEPYRVAKPDVLNKMLRRWADNCETAFKTVLAGLTGKIIVF
jgi:hypothetical protein